MRPDGKEKVLCLRRHEPTGACVFLLEIAPGVARCGAYPHRPLVCRIYPATLARGVVSVRPDTKCGPDAWNLATMDLCAYRQDLEQARAAWTEHLRLAQTWNDRITREYRTVEPEELFDYVLTGIPEPA
jgi:Fe-S-cluster containining protein